MNDTSPLAYHAVVPSSDPVAAVYGLVSPPIGSSPSSTIASTSSPDFRAHIRHRCNTHEQHDSLDIPDAIARSSPTTPWVPTFVRARPGGVWIALSNLSGEGMRIQRWCKTCTPGYIFGVRDLCLVLLLVLVVVVPASNEVIEGFIKREVRSRFRQICWLRFCSLTRSISVTPKSLLYSDDGPD